MLEAFYFKKPVVVNRYSIYVQDIEPKGFSVVEMDGYVTRETVDEVKKLLGDEEQRQEVVELNYRLAKRYYGYEALRNALNAAFNQIDGGPTEEVTG